MRSRHLPALSLCPLALALLLFSCSTGNETGLNESVANEEVAASMGSDEAGATYALAADLSEATGTTVKSAVTLTSEAKATATIVAGSRTCSVTYYSGLDGTGSVLGTTAGSIPDGTNSAVVSSTRVFTVTALRADSTVTVTASYVVNNIQATTGSWGVKGSVEVLRDAALASGTSVTCDTIHSIDWDIATSDSAVQKGGTASTEAVIQINGGKTLDFSYSWVFEGDGTAIMTTERGTTVTVTVE